MSSCCVVGIDLGTSNCAISTASLSEGSSSDEAEIYALSVPQVAGPGSLQESRLLPSAILILPEDEYHEGGFKMPWGEDVPYVIGNYARERGGLMADRLVASAKSWLCNTRVDRRERILPWGSELVNADLKLSPLMASALYLSHLREALANSGDQFNGDKSVVLTVPASFDEVARSLTLEAAQESGWGAVTLLEEPLAAFYDWVNQTGRNWRKQIQPGDLVLVCDVGGGTADFSLIAVSENEGQLDLRRVSVGDHSLLGGDNMDLALAFHLRESFQAAGEELDAWSFKSLVHQARAAKEKLLDGTDLESVSITLPSRGSDLFADPKVVELKRSDVVSTIVDGFFPEVSSEDRPRRGRLSGLREVGLPFEADAALTRHLAGFLRQSMSRVRADESLSHLLSETSGDALWPTAVLFNGGVFNSERLRERLRGVLSSWAGSEVRELVGADRDLVYSDTPATVKRIPASSGAAWATRTYGRRCGTFSFTAVMRGTARYSAVSIRRVNGRCAITCGFTFAKT